MEAVKVLVRGVQLAVVVSQVPLVAAAAPLLSHHCKACAPALLAKRDKAKPALVDTIFFIIIGRILQNGIASTLAF